MSRNPENRSGKQLRYYSFNLFDQGNSNEIKTILQNEKIFSFSIKCSRNTQNLSLLLLQLFYLFQSKRSDICIFILICYQLRVIQPIPSAMHMS